MSEYTQQWFLDRAERSDRDWHLLVPDIVAAIGKCPRSVIDLGCGDGSALRWFREAGAESLVGVDANGPPEWSRGIGLHLRHDLTQPIDLRQRADLVVCVEVAEHLPESAADTLVENLVRHGDRILFSAAPPGQGGTGHINEQPPEYWQRKFAKFGYEYQDLFRHRLHPDVSPWFRANLTLVAKPEKLIRVPNTKVTTARYRDCFKDVNDTVNELCHDPDVLVAFDRGEYGELPIGAFQRPDAWELVDDAALLEDVSSKASQEHDRLRLSMMAEEKRRENRAGHARMLRDVYRSRPWGLHELAFSAAVSKMRDLLASESVDMPEWADAEYSFWLDADQSFRAQQAIDLVVACHENGWDAATGLYCTKEKNARIIHKPPVDAQGAIAGPYARPYRVPGIGFGFVVVRNDTLLKMLRDPRSEIERTWHSSGCFAFDPFRERIGEPDHQVIDPMTGWATGPRDSEDFSWASMMGRCGLDIWAVPSIFVGHIGRTTFGIENLEHLRGR